MTKVIEVTVSSKGDATVETKGYSGSDCLQASKFLEETLGVVVNDQKLHEYFQSSSIQQEATQ
jgi:hypothetical protein